MRFLNEKVYRIGICPKKYRKMIALEAPDGTGKTTFIDALTVMLAETFVCDIEKCMCIILDLQCCLIWVQWVKKLES